MPLAMKAASTKVGIIGSGQLGWMMIVEGRRLGNTYYTLADDAGPATRVGDGVFSVSDYRKFVDKCDVVTPEFEHVDQTALRYASREGKLFPPLGALNLKIDRSLEKAFLQDHGFPIAGFRVARNRREAIRLARGRGRAVIKGTHGGYDGKTQCYFGVEGKGFPELPTSGRFVVEDYVDYDVEASIIASRDRDGRMLFHQPTFNRNEGGILLSNEAPCPDHGMRRIASRLMDALDYVGVLAVEFFIVNGRPLVNEFAPRVHNSGHHTLHGSSISQFEQHLRVITGLPVPEPVLFRSSGIVNAVGIDIGRRLREELLSIPETHVYSYGKRVLRRRRKMGHVNITAPNRRTLRERTSQVADLLYDKDPVAFLEA